MATIPITKRGAEKLKEELHRLKTVERPAVITAIAEARAQGDLSENADYDAAKDRQGFIEGRIQEIEGKLSVAQVIDPSAVDGGGKVVFGATVELEDEESGDTVKYQIVGEDEADLKQGLINISSPIARALIGKEEGDTAEVQAPGGIRATRSWRSATCECGLAAQQAATAFVRGRAGAGLAGGVCGGAAHRGARSILPLWHGVGSGHGACCSGSVRGVRRSGDWRGPGRG
jgi:transcription elongation factor GreA